MAAATPTALIEQIPGSSLLNAFQNVGGPLLNLDIIQIIDGNGNIILNVDKAGVVRFPASNATTSAGGVAGQTRLGQFKTYLTGAQTVATLFASAFSNPSLLDILQIVNIGGNVSYWLDYLGVAHGA
jgi:hypothetical protein